MPVCSVITPCYNSADFISATIESVIKQQYQAWEYILVDDGSSDATARIVERYRASEPRLRLIQQPNSGVAAARQRGYGAVSPESRYLLFLDHDDCLAPEALATLIRYLDDRPEVGAVCCAIQPIDSEGKPTQLFWSQHPRRAPTRFGSRILADDEAEMSFATLVGTFKALPSATLIRRTVFEQAGGWDTTYHLVPDKDIILRIALHAPVHYLSAPLTQYRWHPANMSHHPAMQDEFASLEHRWWSNPRLTPGQRRTVRRAFVFLHYCGAQQGFAYWLSHTRRGEFGHASRWLRYAFGQALRLAALSMRLIDRETYPAKQLFQWKISDPRS